MRLTPTERLALEHIRAGRPVNILVLERAIAKRWVKRGKPPTLSEAGEKAIRDDDDAIGVMRSAAVRRR
jgi:hypothetical protein